MVVYETSIHILKANVAIVKVLSLLLLQNDKFSKHACLPLNVCNFFLLLWNITLVMTENFLLLMNTVKDIDGL